MSPKLKDKLNIKLMLLHESKCLAFRLDHRGKMGVGKMYILRYMNKHTLRDKVRNEDIRKGLGVVSIDEEMKTSFEMAWT